MFHLQSFLEFLFSIVKADDSCADALNKPVLCPLPNISIYLTVLSSAPVPNYAERLQIRNTVNILSLYKYPTSNVKVFRLTIKTWFVNSFSSCLKHTKPFLQGQIPQIIYCSSCFLLSIRLLIN